MDTTAKPTNEATDTESVGNVERLADTVASPEGAGHNAPELTAKAVANEVPRALNDVLLSRMRNWKKRTQRLEIRSLLWAIGIIGSFMFTVLAKPLIGMEAAQIIGFAVMGILMVVMLVEQWISSANNNAVRESFAPVLETVSREPNRTLLPVLLELYTSQSKHLIGLRNDTQRALLAVLPTLNKSQANLLSGVERQQLNTILALSRKLVTSQKPELTVAALRVLELAEDRNAIPMVEYLAKSGITPSICKVASECSARFKERSLAPANTLLRGSSHGDEKSDVLLRAASGIAPAQQDGLLRPASSGPSEITAVAAGAEVTHADEGESVIQAQSHR